METGSSRLDNTHTDLHHTYLSYAARPANVGCKLLACFSKTRGFLAGLNNQLILVEGGERKDASNEPCVEKLSRVRLIGNALASGGELQSRRLAEVEGRWILVSCG